MGPPHFPMIFLSLAIFFIHASIPCHSCPSDQYRFSNYHAEAPAPSYLGEAPSYDVGSLELHHRVVNVLHYGAKGDGISNDRKAFRKAWKHACSSSAPSVLLVPEHRKYLLKPVSFYGPCKSSVTVMIQGTIEAPSDPADWHDMKDTRHWIHFDRVENLVVGGGGTVDGHGQKWWQNSCKINTTLPCVPAPTALTFSSCNGLRVEQLRIKDSQQIHVSIENCTHVTASELSIFAPEASPNTDGIHVARTTNIVIADCDIRTGDDCISIETGCRNIEIMNILCGPGHGISIGSLGDNNSKAHVSNVMVDTVILTGTTNGVRIKTWQGGHGYAENVVFQNIVVHNVSNPIIIDQNYCDRKQPCHEKERAVAVRRVLYKNIQGTSATKVAVKFDCSRAVPCHEIVMQDIKLVGEDGQHTRSLCKHVKWTTTGTVIPQPCDEKK